MEIIVGKTSGFCYGVKTTIEKTEKILEDNKSDEIYCLGELVHNKTIIDDFKAKGIKFINNIEEAKKTTIIRAHGIEKNIYEKAKRRNIELIDLTCPSVLKIHEIVEKYAKNDYYIFLVGKKEHPETIGTYSFCGKNSCIISKSSDVEKALENFSKTNLGKTLIIVQTTYSKKEFEEIVEKIKENLPQNILLEIKNTICKATELRQEETKSMSKKVDLMVIVGGKNSSNTNKLYEIAKANCKKCICVETAVQLDIAEIEKSNKVGIMAGASTPEESIQKILEKVEKIIEI